MKFLSLLGLKSSQKEEIRKLDFLAQINFEEMPELEDYPRSGILQFYIDPEWDMDYDNQLNSNIKVVYYPMIEKVCQTDFLELDSIRKEKNYIPPYKENLAFKIDFNMPEYEAVALCDFRFQKMPIELYDDENEEYYDTFLSNHHKIGGYAFFTQTDIREYNEHDYPQYTKLLLQLDSDEYLCWGDAGVANFFIKPEDLKKRDFSKVLFNWDCH